MSAEDTIEPHDQPLALGASNVAESRRADESNAWLERIMTNMKRMTEDEPYRQTIAAKLS